MRCPRCNAPVDNPDWGCCMEWGCGYEFTPADFHPEQQPAPKDESSPEGNVWIQVEIPPPPAVLLPAVREQHEVHECHNCGATPDKFIEGACKSCGAQAVLKLRDDFFIKVSERVAACSNYGGIGHDRNEDSTGCGCVTIGDKTISWFVVCDGLSTSKNPQEASEAAVAAADAELKEAALNGELASADLLTRSTNAAWHAVEKVPPEQRANEEYSSPATTIVVGYAYDGEDPWVGWCGDSRAYGIYHEGENLVCRQLSRDHTVLNDVLDEMQRVNPDFQPDPNETMYSQIARAEKYLGERYKQAFLANDEETMKDLKQDVEVKDAENGVVEFTSVHTMVWCLMEFPQGMAIRPSFARVPKENLVCLFGCSDGVWNDAHPMDSIDAPKLADMLAASNGDALTFVEAAVASASGMDNNSCAAILF